MVREKLHSLVIVLASFSSMAKTNLVSTEDWCYRRAAAELCRDVRWKRRQRPWRSKTRALYGRCRSSTS